MIEIPQDLLAVLRSLRRHGRPYLVGGCVRDALLGKKPKDFDIEVFGVSWEDLQTVLERSGPTDVVGRSFAVAKLRLPSGEHDFALPRRESKTGAGHRGFRVEADQFLDERGASMRRDFTINSLLFEPFEQRVLDFHGGVEDLERRFLRHTSAAFTEDPLRVLRGFQFAARFELKLVPETAQLCASMLPTYGELATERVWGEWEKFITQATKPSMGLRVLSETGWIAHFPVLAALAGLEQEPSWHPEGDVLTHIGHCLDALVALPEWRDAGHAFRRVLSLAVLAHDFGKAGTTVREERHGALRWISPGHDRTGGALAESFLEGIGSPLEIRPVVRALVENHHAHQSWPLDGPSPSAVRRLAKKIQPATISQLLIIMTADHLGRPPLVSAQTRERIARLRNAAAELAVGEAAPAPILRGRDLIAEGVPPGARMGAILKAAYEAQLGGAFYTRDEALGWARTQFSDIPVDRRTLVELPSWRQSHLLPLQPNSPKHPLMNTLEALKQHTVVVADTGDFKSLREFSPRDATTNPSLILKAAQMPEYGALIDQAVADNRSSSLRREALLERIIDQVLILFGLEILKIVPGRVSTEVDARHSFDTMENILVARELIAFYEKHGIERERVLIKIASTWEGIAAAEVLERDGIHCNLTLLFSLPQAVRCAEAKVTLISPFVGRILDWHKAKHGRDYAGHEDPGVVSVKQIYDYYKKFDYKTEVMGASFRNTDEILELCGCDLLTISPDLLKKLKEDSRPAPAKLSATAAKSSNIERLELDEKRFRFLFNEDAMATEKTAEGIRTFAADIVKLEKLIEKKLG